MLTTNGLSIENLAVLQNLLNFIQFHQIYFLNMDANTIEHLRWGTLQLILLIISIGLHEFGHAWAADLRGDPLPRAQGRVTINPFAHTDPIGTILIPAVMIFLSPAYP